METIDKILCCDKGNNSDPMAMAAMMNGGLNNQSNNPFIYLVWMMFARSIWGNDENKVQDAKFEISQLKQNQYIAQILNGGCACGLNNQ